MEKQFIDGNSTFIEWNNHKNDICILPVGAMEQHSLHLPLVTDSLLAMHFATFLAEQLQAALLPVLGIATSYEHSGFRGTFSLKPETLMSVIRDIAGEAEKQAFRTLIIFNYHGGNFSLMPVVRDWNRRDRPLKIILYFPRNMPRDNAELHAGEWETSLMMHLYPELVKNESADITEPKWLQQEFQPPDLNTFGVGHIAAQGAVGFPSRASAEKGKEYAEWIQKDAVTWINQRLEWLQKQRNYSGRGGVTLRLLDSDDLERAMELKSMANWNQTRRDWQHFLDFSPKGCFAAIKNGKVTGTVTTTEYKDLAWIGMVLVDAAVRRQGIATRLLSAAVEHLQHISSIKLDATPEGMTVYERLGFTHEFKILRLTSSRLLFNPSVLPLEMVRQINENDLKEIIDYDADVFGQPRGQVLKALYSDYPEFALVFSRGGSIGGYCFGRRGSSYLQIGPLVGQNLGAARILLAAFCRQAGEKELLIDVPEHNDDWLQFLQQSGFQEKRYFIRMVKGSNRYAGNIKQQFAIAGPEIG